MGVTLDIKLDSVWSSAAVLWRWDDQWDKKKCKQWQPSFLPGKYFLDPRMPKCTREYQLPVSPMSLPYGFLRQIFRRQLWNAMNSQIPSTCPTFWAVFDVSMSHRFWTLLLWLSFGRIRWQDSLGCHVGAGPSDSIFGFSMPGFGFSAPHLSLVYVTPAISSYPLLSWYPGSGSWAPAPVSFFTLTFESAFALTALYISLAWVFISGSQQNLARCTLKGWHCLERI